MSAIGVSVTTLAGVPLLAGADAEALETLAADAHPLRALAGDWVMREGDDADDLYVVLRGRLRVIADADGEERTLRVLGPGAAIGELALLTGAPRSASVQAVRDTTLLQLSRERFVELMERDPRFAAAVARELASQLQASGGLDAPPSRPALIALKRLGSEVPLEQVARSLAQSLERYGPVELLGPEAAGTNAVERAEDENAHVLLLDEAGAGVWSDLCARQADRMLLVATEHSPVPASPSPDADLVILGPSSGDALRSLLDAVAPRTHHRLATTEPSDPGAGRLARRVVGRALGVVLSGGGARGFAHIGALAELETDGIEVDRYGGCSMGSFIAAMAAAGWSAQDIRDRCHEELVRRSPFNDYTIPRVALIRSRKAARMFDRLFGELTIEELARPLFTVSADLLSSRLVVHRRGSLIEAVGASMSIPGLAPPLSAQRPAARGRRGAQQPSRRRDGRHRRGPDRRDRRRAAPRGLRGGRAAASVDHGDAVARHGARERRARGAEPRSRAARRHARRAGRPAPGLRRPRPGDRGRSLRHTAGARRRWTRHDRRGGLGAGDLTVLEHGDALAATDGDHVPGGRPRRRSTTRSPTTRASSSSARTSERSGARSA